MHVGGYTATYRSSVKGNMHLVGERYFLCRYRLNCDRAFTYFCILLCICYCYSHLIGWLSVTWLSLLYKFTRFFFIFCFSLTEGQYSKHYSVLSILAVHRLFYISIRNDKNFINVSGTALLQNGEIRCVIQSTYKSIKLINIHA